MKRSAAHMLLVAAACFERDFGDAKLIKDLRAGAKMAAKRSAEGRDWKPADQKRVDHQRTAMAQITNDPAKAALLKAMLQRAYDLMWEGRCEACDAVAEWLPSEDVDKMFEAWGRDQEGKEPMSSFYAGGL